MAIRYITVHGTNDSEPDPNDPKWWQRESDFARDLLAKAGGGKIEPFVWDGKNDELSRREAAERLLFLLTDYDNRGQEIVLIGHSHGGSVIATALKLAMSTERKFENIRSIISVGTPFIHMKPQRFLLQRLNFTGQLALLYAVSVFFLLLASISTLTIFAVDRNVSQARENMRQAKQMGEDYTNYSDGMVSASLVEQLEIDTATAYATIGTSIIIILIAGYLILRSQRRLNRLHNSKIAGLFHDTFSGKWLAIFDKRDEAINALTRIFDLRLNLMNRTQSRGPVRFVVVMATVFLLGSSVVADELYSSLNKVSVISAERERRSADEYAPSEVPPAIGEVPAVEQTPVTEESPDETATFQDWLKDYAENSWAANVHLSLYYDLAQPAAFETLLWYNLYVAPELEFLPDYLTATTFSENGQPTIVMVFVTDIIATLLKVLIVVAAFWSADAFNRILFGPVFARSLNSAFNGQVKREALGNTTKGEDLVGVGRVPKGWTEQAQPFSEKASNALSEYAASHARETLIRVQDVLGDESIHTDHTLVDELMEQLSWRELIHTAYFRVPESREFIVDQVIRKSGLTPQPVKTRARGTSASELASALNAAEAEATVGAATISIRPRRTGLQPASPEYPVLRRPVAPQP